MTTSEREDPSATLRMSMLNDTSSRTRGIQSTGAGGERRERGERKGEGGEKEGGSENCVQR